MKYVIFFFVFFVFALSIPDAFSAEVSKIIDFIEMADEAILDGRYTEAATLLRKAVDRNPENWDARLKLIGLLVQVAGKEDEAVKEIEIILKMKKVEPETLDKIGAACEEYDFPDEAIKLYKKILEQEGADASIQRKVINILIANGNSEEANKEIDAYVENSSFARDDLMKLGEFCEEKLEFTSAIHVYEKIAEKYPDFIDARLRLAKSYARSGNLDEAKKAVEKCLKLKPRDPGVRLFLANLKSDSGEYDDALKLYGAVLKEHPEYTGALSGKAEVLFITGRYQDAESAYKLALEDSNQSAVILKKLGDLYKYIGKYEEAEASYRKAALANPSSTDAVIGLAQSYWLRGRFSDAEDEFYKLYDIWEEVESPKELSARVLTNIGIACQYNDNPEDALTCYTMAQDKDSRYIPARLALGRLFLERHQGQDAANEFNDLLDINPNQPGALSGLAIVYLERGRYELVEEICNKALSINPNHIELLNIMALMQMFDRQWDEAIASINKALDVNPNSIETQSYLASYYYHTEKKDLYSETEKKVLSINPKYAEFYRVVSFISEKQRRNAEAIDLLRKAIAVNPNHATSYAAIGRILMREGVGDSAQEYLDKAFELDPYNPRMANSINLLKYIKRDFITEETENFIVRWDREKDFVLKYFLPEYVERIYPEITGHFGYKPPIKTVFDMFPEHRWFSARISGMPFIATVGACFGKVFAMDSPRKSGFDWQKVLEHEFTHVVTLQQTNFNIPFWFTEGLAVHWEKGYRPIDWDRMLVRMKFFDELVPIDNLNSWFTRPRNMDQKQWAYAQSEFIVEYVYKKWGREAILKMLDMYADNKPTAEIIKKCLGIPQEEFEKQVHAYCMDIAEKIPLGPKFMVGDKERFEKLMKDEPENPEYNSNYARLLVQTINLRMKSEEVDKVYDNARKYALKAIELKSKKAVPHSILAYCDFQQKKYSSARKHAEEALKNDEKNFSAHYYLGKLDYRDEEFDKAIAHFEKAKSIYPRMTDIHTSLAAIYEERKDDMKVIENLEEIITYSNKPYKAAKLLLELHVQHEHYDDAIRVADLCLRYNLYDPEVYKLAGDAYKAVKNRELHIRYYLIGSEVAYWFGSKEVKKDMARKFLTLALEMDPEHEKAKELLDKIGGPIEPDDPEEEEMKEDVMKLLDEGAGEKEEEDKQLNDDIE